MSMHETHGSVKSLSIGFGFSLILTVTAFTLVVLHHDSGHTFIGHELMIPIVICLALLQLLVQLIFFLHIPFESHPRFRLLFLISTIGIILLVVVGSLWIMQNLNHNMMPQQMEEYILWKEGIEH